VQGFAYVLVTNDRGKAEFPRTSERVGSDIRTFRVVAKIFSEQFFATVWRLEARLDRYLRNGASPQPTTSILTRRVARRKQISAA
jgi:hypothetical protein